MADAIPISQRDCSSLQKELFDENNENVIENQILDLISVFSDLHGLFSGLFL